MFINKLNQLYKPNRILFYQEASKEQIDDFYRGVIPEAVASHTGAFGTYDLPGVFYVKNLEKEVIGIEYRMDDERVVYPSELSSVVLEGSFFYSIEIDEEIKADRAFIDDLLAVFFRKSANPDLNIVR